MQSLFLFVMTLVCVPPAFSQDTIDMVHYTTGDMLRYSGWSKTHGDPYYRRWDIVERKVGDTAIDGRLYDFFIRTHHFFYSDSVRESKDTSFLRVEGHSFHYYHHVDRKDYTLVNFDDSLGTRYEDRSVMMEKRIGSHPWTNAPASYVLTTTGVGDDTGILSSIGILRRYHYLDIVHYEHVLVGMVLGGQAYGDTAVYRMPVSVEEAALAGTMTTMVVYPNVVPVGSRTLSVILNLPRRTNLQVKLYSMTGQALATITEGSRDGGMHMMSLDLTRLRIGAGNYLVVLTTTAERVGRRIVLY